MAHYVDSIIIVVVVVIFGLSQIMHCATERAHYNKQLSQEIARSLADHYLLVLTLRWRLPQQI